MAEAGERERMATDVVIVGAGPAGLAAAIRLRRRAPELSVTVVEKAAEIGGHILSGAVMNPAGLDVLIPDWRAKSPPAATPVTADRFHYLTATRDIPFPGALLPPQMKTPGALIISLGDYCRWLADQATALGVDIFPMTAAVDVLTNGDGAVTGIITGDLGVDRDGRRKPGFAAGIALEAKYTLVAEGARGSLAKRLLADFRLTGRTPQKYGLGIKEIWELAPERHQIGRIDHYLGYPLDDATSGGGFAYHAADGRLFIGYVVHLDYRNPTLSPFDEFQRFKAHPAVAPVLEGARRIAYGARALTSGGWQAVPDLAFPGGALIGCVAGFMNVPALKGIHNAIRSGLGAADAVAAAIAEGRAHDRLEGLRAAVLATGIGDELRAVANVKPLWSRYGTRAGVALAGLDMWATALIGRSPFGTLRLGGEDCDTLMARDKVTRIAYPRPDGRTGFDRASSVHLANIAHHEDQPNHLRLADPDIPLARNLPLYGEPAPLYCPAGVYELAEEGGRPVFRIHPANCVHCKTCDIKDPARNITWVPPEGGSGPGYRGM